MLYAIPGLCYACVNNLSFYSSLYLQPHFQVLFSNIYIVNTAFCQTVFLGTRFTKRQWIGM